MFHGLTGGPTEIFCHRLCQNLQKLGAERFSQFPPSSEQVPLGNHIHEGCVSRYYLLFQICENAKALYSRNTREASGFRQLLRRVVNRILFTFIIFRQVRHNPSQIGKGSRLQTVLHLSPHHRFLCSQHGFTLPLVNPLRRL